MDRLTIAHRNEKIAERKGSRYLATIYSRVDVRFGFNEALHNRMQTTRSRHHQRSLITPRRAAPRQGKERTPHTSQRHRKHLLQNNTGRRQTNKHTHTHTRTHTHTHTQRTHVLVQSRPNPCGRPWLLLRLDISRSAHAPKLPNASTHSSFRTAEGTEISRGDRDKQREQRSAEGTEISRGDRDQQRDTHRDQQRNNRDQWKRKRKKDK